MKQLITLITCFVLALQVCAQDVDLVNRIKTTNSKIKSFDADLKNTIIKPKKTSSQEGKLYFVSPNEFAALFTTGKYMIVNAERINIEIGLFSGVYRLRDGGIMRSLSNIFLYGFQGRIQQLADENGYSVTTDSKNGYHIVTCTIKKKKRLIGIGYKQVVFKYHTDSLLLKEIILFDYKGNMDIYTISNVQYDVAVNPNTFIF